MLQENSSVILDKILIYARLEAALRREFKEKDHVVKKKSFRQAPWQQHGACRNPYF
jgi:hypothetical protein